MENYHGYYEYKTLKKLIGIIDEILKETHFIENEDEKFLDIYTKYALFYILL